MDPLLVIANRQAGAHDDRTMDIVLAVLRREADVELCSGSQDELDGVLHRRGRRRIVVAGGDGTLHAVVAALHRRHELADAVLGLVPLGTGNDFARSSGIPLDPEEAARLVMTGRTRRLDVVVDCVGQVVVNSVHLGVGAQASRKAGAWKERLGRVGYLMGAALASVRPPFLRLRVEVDGQLVAGYDQPVLQLAVGNGSRVGGGTELIPGADPGDGALDVMISFAVGPIARADYALRLWRRGNHEGRDDVHALRGSTVSVSGGPFYCSADGEDYGPEQNRTWRVEPAAFTMVLPG